MHDVAAGTDVPAHSVDGLAAIGDDRYSEVMGCQVCENGSAVLPALYQPFKRDVVAALPEDGWTLTQADILGWVTEHAATI
jgi:hypothetical protein